MSHSFLPNSLLTVIFCIAGFRPGSRAPFVPAKGAKTNDAPSGLINEMDARQGRARQLAALKQGSPGHGSVHLEGRVAGVGS